jgi:hypothetical protein
MPHRHKPSRAAAASPFRAGRRPRPALHRRERHHCRVARGQATPSPMPSCRRSSSSHHHVAPPQNLSPARRKLRRVRRSPPSPAPPGLCPAALTVNGGRGWREGRPWAEARVSPRPPARGATRDAREAVSCFLNLPGRNYHNKCKHSTGVVLHLHRFNLGLQYSFVQSISQFNQHRTFLISLTI